MIPIPSHCGYDICDIAAMEHCVSRDQTMHPETSHSVRRAWQNISRALMGDMRSKLPHMEAIAWYPGTEPPEFTGLVIVEMLNGEIMPGNVMLIDWQKVKRWCCLPKGGL